MPNFQIKEISFVGSFSRESQCPKSQLPEFAFIGRSNVGKSSLINMLTSRKSLARVSNTPGKTQLINYFRIDETWHLVDLPGYGYAKVSKKHRASLRKMMDQYLLSRSQLQCAFILIDSRINLQAIDLEICNWMGSQQIPFVIAYTKTDKLKPKQLKENLKKIESQFLEYWEEMPQCFITSSKSGKGRDEILKFVSTVLTKS